ncbi:MAG: hypothetical protein ACRDDY_17830 [Clostridium sp.]
MRNRISHRYKEPSFEDIHEFISENESELKKLIQVAEKYRV